MAWRRLGYRRDGRRPHPRTHLPGRPLRPSGAPPGQAEDDRRRRALHPDRRLAHAHRQRRLPGSRRGLLHQTRSRTCDATHHPPSQRPGPDRPLRPHPRRRVAGHRFIFGSAAGRAIGAAQAAHNGNGAIGRFGAPNELPQCSHTEVSQADRPPDAIFGSDEPVIVSLSRLTLMPMTARCASATNPVAPGTASVIPPTKTQAAVPDETLAHVELSALRRAPRPRVCEPLRFAQRVHSFTRPGTRVWVGLSLIHISEPTRLGMISYAVFCLKKK